MSDLDVALRLRLVDQFSGKAKDAKRELKDLQDAARKLGRSGGDGLSRDLDKIGSKADAAKRNIKEIDRAAAQLGRGKRGLKTVETDAEKAALAVGKIKTKADQAEQGIRGIGTAADTTRTKLNDLGDAPGLRNIKADADRAEAAVRQIGTASDATNRKLRETQRIHGRGPGAGLPPPTQDRRLMGRDMTHGFTDRSGLDGVVPVGGGAGYMIGAGVATAGSVAARTYGRFASQDRDINHTLETMKVPDAERDGVKQQLRDIARDARMPYPDVERGFGALGTAGLKYQESLGLLPMVARTALAIDADPADVAATIYDLRSKMKISDADMPLALDYLKGGGELGRFEAKDMAQFGPVVMPFAATAGYTGLEGWKKLMAMMQTVRENAPDSSSAASYMADLLFKHNAPETERNFKDAGIDLKKELAAGDAKGDDRIATYMRLLERATGGKDDAINNFLTDKQVYQAGLALAANKDRIAADAASLDSSRGSVEATWGTVSRDDQASIDAASNALLRLQMTIGKVVANVASPLSDMFATEVDKAAQSPLDTLSALNRYSSPIAISKDALRRAIGSGELGKPIGELEWPAVDNRPARTRGGVSDARPMPMGPDDLKKLTGRYTSALDADVSAAAAATMESYNSELKAGTGKALGTVAGFVAQLKSMLNFTAGPAIAPTFAPADPAAPAAAPQKSSAVVAPAPVKLTQNISSPNARLAARAAVREQNRTVRLAQNRALHDLGSVA